MENCPYCGSPLPTPTPVTCPSCGSPLLGPGLPSGTLLQGGQYRVERVLGQGGFGITYAASDLTLRREVAIKELFPDGSVRNSTSLVPPTSFGGQGFLEARNRFLDEARTLAQFNHPGVVRVLDVFEENGTAYLVMELLHGETLGSRIASTNGLPARDVAEVAAKVGEALRVVHAAGLLHRDIKPDNVFLTGDGRTVLIDFGSARAFATSRTVRHTQLVTPGYAPLEQYATQAQFGPPTDIYALGATLYHALAGKAPPSSPDRVNGAPLPPLPASTPVGLRRAVESALALRVDERPQDTNEFLSLLRSTEPPAWPDVARDVPPRQRRQTQPAAPVPWQPQRVVERELYRSPDAVITTARAVLQGRAYDLSDFGAVSVRTDPEHVFTGGSGCSGWGCLIPFVFFFIFPAFINTRGGSMLPFLLLMIGLFMVMGMGGRRRRVTVLKHYVVMSSLTDDLDVYVSRDRAVAEAVARSLQRAISG